jgi:hypothetical protein
MLGKTGKVLAFKIASQRILVALVAAVLLALFAVDSAEAQIRLRFPEQTPGGPVYARVERPFLIHTDEWAAIVFYRDPTCVPEDFNLLDMLDFQGFPENPRVFGCPLMVEGFEIRNGPELNVPPRLVFTRGTGAVPVWFVVWSELQAAIADDVLRITELRAMRSLQMGYANFFEETLDLSEAAQTLRLVIVARGALLDGRSFQFHFVFTGGTVRVIRIVFGR